MAMIPRSQEELDSLSSDFNTRNFDSKKIGTELAHARQESKLRQSDAAQAIDIKRTSLSAMENGHRLPSLYEMYWLCALYNISMTEVLERSHAE